MPTENDDRTVRVSADTGRLLEHTKTLVRLHGLKPLSPWVQERVLQILGERLPTLDAVVHAGLVLLALEYQTSEQLQHDLAPPAAANEPKEPTDAPT